MALTANESFTATISGERCVVVDTRDECFAHQRLSIQVAMLSQGPDQSYHTGEVGASPCRPRCRVFSSSLPWHIESPTSAAGVEEFLLTTTRTHRTEECESALSSSPPRRRLFDRHVYVLEGELVCKDALDHVADAYVLNCEATKTTFLSAMKDSVDKHNVMYKTFCPISIGNVV